MFTVVVVDAHQTVQHKATLLGLVKYGNPSKAANQSEGNVFTEHKESRTSGGH